MKAKERLRHSSGSKTKRTCQGNVINEPGLDPGPGENAIKDLLVTAGETVYYTFQIR